MAIWSFMISRTRGATRQQGAEKGYLFNRINRSDFFLISCSHSGNNVCNDDSLLQNIVLLLFNISACACAVLLRHSIHNTINVGTLLKQPELLHLL